jgi:hypothetical protein
MAAAIIQPNFEFLKEWATIHKMDIGKLIVNMSFMKSTRTNTTGY